MKLHLKMFILLFLVIVTYSSNKSLADKYFPETAPFEISLLYHKIIGTTPNFKKLAMQSPTYLDAPEIGKDIILGDQISRLKALFYALSDKKPITIVDNLSLLPSENDKNDEAFIIKEMNDGLNYIYDIEDETYIVFVRNAEKLNKVMAQSLKEKASLKRVVNSKVKIGAEIVLKPISADVKPFNYKGEDMRLILADISLLRLINNAIGEEIVQFEPIKDIPEATKMELFFNNLVKERQNSSWQNQLKD